MWHYYFTQKIKSGNVEKNKAKITHYVETLMQQIAANQQECLAPWVYVSQTYLFFDTHSVCV